MMKKTNFTARSTRRGSTKRFWNTGIALGCLLVAESALAQGVPGSAQIPDQAAATDSDLATDAEVVVTGSLFKDPRIAQSSPVLSIGRDEIALRQTNVAEELLRTIPGAVPNIGATVNSGNQGASFVNLRGLGENRNLVLLDGQRIVPAGLSGAVDLNNIPIALIDRVDVLTGGASTTYGADAVAGVVNFILRRDFAGLQLNASNQITGQGDGRVYRADLSYGLNFAEGRGNVVVGGGYLRSAAIYLTDRDFSRTYINAFTGDGGGASSTAVPSRFSGLRALDGTRNATLQLDPATGGFVNPYSFFDFNAQFALQTPFERINGFGSARFKLSDAAEFYARGLYSRNEVRTLAASSGTFGATVTLPLSNPFLTPTARQQFCAFDTDPGPAYTPRFSPAVCAAAATATDPNDPNYRSVATSVSRRFVEAGPRVSRFRTEMFDARGGVRGNLTAAIGYDLSVGYGESANTQIDLNAATFSRLQQALNATNTTTCLDPSNGCIPVNLFGDAGSITAEQLAFLQSARGERDLRTTLLQVRGLLSGDIGVTSPFATVPINLAVGAEYRRYGASITSNLVLQTPGEVLGNGSAQPNVTGHVKVGEIFAELVAPLVSERPLLHSLQADLGIRASEYSTTGRNVTWKAGLIWQPVSDVRVRGNYQKAVRSPNIGELYEPATVTTGFVQADPCSGTAVLSNASLAAICRAQGAPASVLGGIEPPFFGAVNATFGGNPDLDVETAKTWSIGAVVQPRLAPGLTLRADYYNSRVDNAITAPTAQDVLTRCFSTTFNPSLAVTPLCAAIRRSPLTGDLLGDVTVAGIPVFVTNQGRIRADGVDFGVDYQIPLGDTARLSLALDGNWTGSTRFQPTIASPDRDCAGYYSTNCPSIQPRWSFNQRTTLTVGTAAFSLLWRYIDGVRYEPAAYADDLAAATNGGVVNPDGLVEDRFLTIPAQHYFDLATRFGIGKAMVFTFTVQNLFNRTPPIVGTGLGAASFNIGNTYPSTYDPLGRRFATSVQVTF